MFRETIFALSSGALPSGVAVIRLSGPHAAAALSTIAGKVPEARQASLRPIRDLQGLLIDRGLVLFFPAPNSFTGEDCAELHLHGGRAVVAAVLSILGSIPDLRQAEAGEFTRRAFVNGRLDLTAAEGLADLIGAETESQRRLAIANAEGGQKVLYLDWRRRLLHARAMIEAELDFSDEGDVPGSVSSQVWADVKAIIREIASHIEGYEAGEIVREGFRVVLVGRPNAGKSSLLNALARREVAIVTEVPGTTRDLVEVALDLGGVKVIVTDTAGLRETTDIVERLGIDRARSAASNADLVLVLDDGRTEDHSLLGKAPQAPVLRIGTKSDLRQRQELPESVDHSISVVTGSGLGGLVAALTKIAQQAVQGATSIVPSRQRHVGLLQACSAHLSAALNEITMADELRAEELRLAGDALGKIVGTVDVEEVLGVIFSTFCIGK